ncbi:MAG: type I secretion system permease/ATPase [Methylophilaceae bacterium]
MNSLAMHKPLRKYLALFKGDLMVVAMFSLATNVLMLAPTLYMLQLYDRVLISKNELTLYAITLITCFLFLVMAFCEWMRSAIVIKAGVRFDQLLSSKVFTLGFAHVLGLENARASEKAGPSQKAGLTQKTMANEAMQDLTYIRQFITGNGLFAFFDMPWTLLYIAVLFILHPMLGMLAIVFCMVQFGLGIWNQRSSESPLEQVNLAGRANQRFLDSKARNIETLHVMGMIPHLYKRWQLMQQRWNQLDGDAIRIQTRNQLINKFIRYTMQSLMLAAAALLAIQGKISIGAMIASNVLIARALQPFDVIVGTWKQFVMAQQSMTRLDQLLASEQPEVKTKKVSQIQGHITLKDLNVTLGNTDRSILKRINLDIHPGQILTVMGPSGSGKTTLARCLAGICPWQGGELLIDGISASSIPHAQWAAALGYLPQDVELIEGSIADNIARFSDPSPADVIAAAQSAGIHDSILRLPQGYDSRINESAAILSGGQRQLLGLARAIYRQPALLLLDEPNSHLDEHGEANLLTALLRLKQEGKAIVLVSHRSSILKITDQLLILQNGEVAHYGTRDAVVAELNHARQLLAAQAA